MMNSLLITEAQTKVLLEYLGRHPQKCNYFPRENRLVFELEGSGVLTLRLPISINTPQDYDLLPNDRANYILIMIRSGIASVGYFEDGENIDHKVFRAYMVRKKQGMSQLKYLKTKGKSRAGSRVRLAETQFFFEEINGRLREYFGTYHVERIGWSCPVTLIPYFYGSKVPPPFNKEDSRIFKIPKHIQNPTFESLMEINRYLLQGEIKYTEEGKDLLNAFLQVINHKKNQPSNDDDW